MRPMPRGWRHRRWVLGMLAALVLAVGLQTGPGRTAHAQTGCQFVLGFATLRTMLGAGPVGTCLEDQRSVANGNAEQQTDMGLLVWRKADNWTAFTNGYETWINGPGGLQKRLNTQRFAWEGDAGVGGTTTITPAPPPAARPLRSYLLTPAEVGAGFIEQSARDAEGEGSIIVEYAN